jgi:hypothetical protein
MIIQARNDIVCLDMTFTSRGVLEIVLVRALSCLIRVSGSPSRPGRPAVGQFPVVALVFGALGVPLIGLFHAGVGAFGRDPRPAVN